MAEPDFNTRAICACDERNFARFRGEFQYIDQWNGWIFVDGPTRSMSPAATFRAFIDRSEFDHKDHTGEPMWVWHDCPWCGGILPDRDTLNPYLFQADGGDGPEA